MPLISFKRERTSESRNSIFCLLVISYPLPSVCQNGTLPKTQKMQPPTWETASNLWPALRAARRKGSPPIPGNWPVPGSLRHSTNAENARPSATPEGASSSNRENHINLSVREQLVDQISPGFDVRAGRGLVVRDVARPAKRLGIVRIIACAASLQGDDVVAFEPTGSATNNTTKSISLEYLFSEFLPFPLV